MRPVLLVLALLAGVAHCAPSKDGPASSGAAHTANAIVWNNDVHQWAAVPYEQIDGMPGPDKLLGVDDPVTVRLQEWLNRLHRAAAAMVLEQTGQTFAAPQPIVKVMREPSVNGQAVSTTACLEPAPPADGRGVVALERGKPGGYLLPSRTCRVPSNWPATGATEWFNGLGICQLGMEGSPPPGDACAQIGDRMPAIRVMTPFINFATGNVRALSEPALVAVLAHELGHYYHSNSTPAHSDKNTFWYEREHHEPTRPVPAAEQDAMREAYDWAVRPRAIVEGQRLHPRVVGPLMWWGNHLGRTEVPICKNAGAALNGLPRAILADLRTGAPIRDGAAYLAAEAKLFECASTLPLDARVAGSLAAYLPDSFDAPLLSAGRLDEALSGMNALAQELDQRAAALTDKLERNRIGLYTTEQEADDLAMELAARVGIAPSRVIEGMFETMRARESTDPDTFRELNSGMTTDQCRESYLRGFPRYVPIGDPAIPHHSYCYRVFNMAREAAAHHYEVAPALPELTPRWSELQTNLPAD